MGACKNKVRVNCGLNHYDNVKFIDIEQQPEAVDRYQTCFLQLLTGMGDHHIQNRIYELAGSSLRRIILDLSSCSERKEHRHSSTKPIFDISQFEHLRDQSQHSNAQVTCTIFVTYLNLAESGSRISFY